MHNKEDDDYGDAGCLNKSSVRVKRSHLLLSFSTASEASKRVSLTRSCTVNNSCPPLARTMTHAFCLVRTHTSRSGSCRDTCLSDLPFSKSRSPLTWLSADRDSYEKNQQTNEMNNMIQIHMIHWASDSKSSTAVNLFQTLRAKGYQVPSTE